MGKSRKIEAEARRKIAAALRRYRKDKKLSGYKLAEMLEVDPPTFRKILKADPAAGGVRGLGLDAFIRMRTVLHLDLDDILDLPIDRHFAEPDPDEPDLRPPDNAIPSHARPPAQSTEQKKAGQR